MALIILSACGGSGGSGGSNDPDSPSNPTINEYKGRLEKGAFQQGAEVIAYSWDAVSGLGGESFITTTTDNLGNYTLKSANIKDILYVKAEGYFYNENTAIVSSSTLKLYGFVDSDKGTWNINILTHIIKDRMEYLIENGSTFESAKTQAVTELFSGLGWTAIDPNTSSVATNANLLFLSAAICKNRTVAEVSSLLTALSADLADGTIDLTILDSSFSAVDIAIITSNLNSLYGSCPDIATVKAQVMTQRSLIDTTLKIFTVSPIAYIGVDWYIGCPVIPSGWTSPAPTIREFPDGLGARILWMKSGLLDSTNHFHVSKTYLGTTTTDEPNIILEFFSNQLSGSSKILYFTLSFDSGTIIKHYKQESGVVTEISNLPEKPASTIQSLNSGIYSYASPNLTDGSNTWNVGTLYGYKICADYIEGIYHRGRSIFVENGEAGLKMCGTDYTYTSDGGFMYGTWNARFW